MFSASADDKVGHNALTKKKWISQPVFVGCLEICDLMMFLILGLVTGWTRFGTYVFTGPRALVVVIALFVAFIIFKNLRLYEPAVLRTGFMQFRRAAACTGLTFLTILVLGYLTKTTGDYSRLWIGSWMLSALVVMTSSRYLVSYLYRRLESEGAFVDRYALFSSAEHLPALNSFIARWRRQMPQSHVIAGVFVDGLENADVTGITPGLIKGTIADFEDWSERECIEKAIAVLPADNSCAVEGALKALRKVSLDVDIIAGSIDENWAGREVEKVAGLPAVRIMSRPLRDSQVVLKRVFDVVIASVALLLLSVPLIAISLLVKVSSPGPVLFRQRRHGFNNQLFSVLKFRTMYDAPRPSGTVEQAKRHDPRVTRFGSFLRRTSLDELPQLINVLRGDMSIVGPRPMAAEHNYQYEKVIEAYFARHRIKPGITGWAQVNGYRGEIDSQDKLSKRVACDLYYADNWSLGFDIEIMFKTFGVLIHKNAY